MIELRFEDFGALYRAAFAEQDPERKALLLSAVDDVIRGWAEAIVLPVSPAEGGGTIHIGQC